MHSSNQLRFGFSNQILSKSLWALGPGLTCMPARTCTLWSNMLLTNLNKYKPCHSSVPAKIWILEPNLNKYQTSNAGMTHVIRHTSYDLDSRTKFEQISNAGMSHAFVGTSYDLDSRTKFEQISNIKCWHEPCIRQTSYDLDSRTKFEQISNIKFWHDPCYSSYQLRFGFSNQI